MVMVTASLKVSFRPNQETDIIDSTFEYLRLKLRQNVLLLFYFSNSLFHPPLL